MRYPLPYWYQFTVSGPTLPDFYWNVKSQEERIKKICEDLWKLIQVYKMLVDAINDHEERIQYLEEKVRELEEKINDLYNKYEALISQINSLNQRVNNVENQIEGLDQRITALEQQITDSINQLPTQITNIVNEILDSNEFLQKLTTLINQIITDLLANKIDKVPSATENHIAVFDGEGGIQSAGMSIGGIEHNIINQYVSGTSGQLAMFDTDGKGVVQTGLEFSKMYIEAENDTIAKQLSIANPLSLVYVPIEEGE